jgi:hypothetical protein
MRAFDIHASLQVPRHDMPLLLGSVRTITRSGFAVTYQGQDYLLTAASAVVHATQVSLLS